MKSEFRFLKDLKNHFNSSKIGDDCAVLPKDKTLDYVISSDMLVEDIDFRLEWSNPNFIGHKSLAVSVSDIAAMGGTPVYSMLSIAVPEPLWDSGFLEKFYDGYKQLAGKLRVELVGGDISKTEDKLVIDSTVIGEVPKGSAIFRGGASNGDLIFLSGTIGGAAAGLRLLETGSRYGKELASWQNPLVKQQLRPIPPNGRFLLETATAAIDISDGFSSDLRHLCEASGVGASIAAEKIPIDSNVSGLGLDSGEVFELALHGGEDFVLLFTVNPEKYSRLRDFPFASIGTITDNIGNIELTRNGTTSLLEPKGYRHF